MCPYFENSRAKLTSQELSEEEYNYVENRQRFTEPAIYELLKRNAIPGFDYDDFLARKTKNITIALALSGGGYRAMLLGAGIMTALDDRHPLYTPMSGLIQSCTYIAGISGGSWLVMSTFANDFAPIESLMLGAWSLDQLLLPGVVNFDADKVQSQFQLPKGDTTLTRCERDGILATLKKVFASIVKDSAISHSDATKSSWLEGWLLPVLRDDINSTLPVASSDSSSIQSIITFYNSLQVEVRTKRQAGFHISFTDYWGRALSRRIFAAHPRNLRALVSDSVQQPSFLNFSQPFPIICSVERSPGAKDSSVDSQLFEFTPFEFGSWDPGLSAFIPIKFLGTSLYNGKPVLSSKSANLPLCYRGFDDLAFVTGTSSTLFSHVFSFIYEVQENFRLEASLAIFNILKTFGLSSEYSNTSLPQFHPDYALFSPNPFHGYRDGSLTPLRIAQSPHLYLADGGDDGQNIPFQPLLRPERHVDVILAFDMSSDRDFYPNGTSLEASSARFHSNNSKECFFREARARARFPDVPDTQYIVQHKLNKRPVFFGCDLDRDYPILYGQPADLCGADLPPLLIYNSNSYMGHQTNRSTFKLVYNSEEIAGMISGGQAVASRLNLLFYAKCVMCAVMKREFDRQNATVPKFCDRCLGLYCWHKPRDVE